MALLAALLAASASYAIGVSLPLSGPRQARGEMLLSSMQMKVDAINAAGGVNGKRLELIIRDSGNTAEGSRAAATEFAANERVLAVIGHYDNVAAAAGVPIYHEAHLPVFLPSIGNKEVFGNSPWAFSGTYDDEDEAEIMAVFIKALRHHESVLVLHTADLLEADIWGAFRRKAERIGLKVRDMVFATNTTDMPAPDFVERNLRPLPSGVQAIVILAQSANGGVLIRQLRDRGINLPIYGNSRLSAGEVLEVIGPYYTSDLHAAFPFMFDMGSERAVEFHRQYVERYKTEPSAFAIFAWDGVGLVAEAIRVNGASRQAIRDYLASLNSPIRSYDGASGVLYFDLDGAMIRDTIMGTASSGRFRPCMQQLRVVTDSQTKNALAEKVKEGEVLVVEDVPYYLINVVYAGIEYYRVNQVSAKDLNFEAEFFLWFKWSGDVDIDGIQFLNEIPGRGHRVEMKRATVPAEWHGGQDIHWVSYRYKGTFLHAYDLRQFPFDRQELPLALAHRGRNANKLQLVADLDHIVDWPVREIYPQEWTYLGRRDASATFRYPTAFGDPTYLPGEAQTPYSVYRTSMQIRRILFPYLVTLFLPLAILICVSLLVLLIPKEQFNPRNGLVMSSLLGVLVYHMATARSLPQVGYLMKSDLYFVIAYALLAVLVLGLNAVNLLMARQQEKRAAMLDHWLARAFVTGTLLAYSILTISAVRAAR
jgi:ABC-type branched-subunit amino acid transport system substrate-binding protein